MRTIIESTPNLTIGKNEPLTILNGIIKESIKCRNLNELSKNLKVIDTLGYKYGFGASHCWVKQIGNENRILLITE